MARQKFPHMPAASKSLSPWWWARSQADSSSAWLYSSWLHMASRSASRPQGQPRVLVVLPEQAHSPTVWRDLLIPRNIHRALTDISFPSFKILVPCCWPQLLSLPVTAMMLKQLSLIVFNKCPRAKAVHNECWVRSNKDKPWARFSREFPDSQIRTVLWEFVKALTPFCPLRWLSVGRFSLRLQPVVFKAIAELKRVNRVSENSTKLTAFAKI